MGISVTKLLILLVIVVVVFGTKRLKNVGADLGGAIKSFRSALKEEEEKDTKNNENEPIEGEITSKKNDNG